MQDTHFLNKLPSKLLSWKSPYESLYNHKLDYNHLRLFGCLCYASNLNPSKAKFDTRACKCVHIGNTPNKKGYRLLNLDTSSAFFPKDIFYEHILLYAHKIDKTPIIGTLESDPYSSNQEIIYSDPLPKEPTHTKIE